MLPSTSSSISNAREQTIQSDIRKTPEQNMSMVWWMARAGLHMSPWWSPRRDIELREFWKKTDYLSGAVFTMSAKMTAVPFKILPRDTRIRDHIKQAEQWNKLLYASSQFGEGWAQFYSRFVEDLVTQDNGAFAEIIGPGNPNGPITGRPTSIAHLDASRCQRTGNAEFPVLYRDTDNKTYKLHYTRVMYASQMSSPIAEMYGVGFSSVSRCVNVAQTLLDILYYKQEKLGSRPHRAIIITRGGLDPQDLATAFQVAEGSMDDQGITRYSKVVVTGSSSIEEADAKILELSSLPDGFSEETSINLGMAAIALAFGLDPRELFPGIASNSTRADALIQHLKQRGKGPGQILEITEALFNHKFLPPHLQLQFDFQDDAQDRQVADIRRVRAEKRNLNMSSGTITARIAREQMLKEEEITSAQFEWMELQDGRLEDGSDVMSLFYSDDPAITKYLDLGVKDPQNLIKVDPEAILPKIDMRLMEAKKDMVNASDRDDKWVFLRSIAALEHLKKMYLKVISKNVEEPVQRELAASDMTMQEEEEEQLDENGKPITGDKVRAPNQAAPDMDREINPQDAREPHSDVKPTQGNTGKEVGDYTDFPFEQETKAFITSKERYGREIRNLVRQLWHGEINVNDFYSSMIGIVSDGLTAAWHEGAREYGLQPEDLNGEEMEQIHIEIANESAYIMNFARSIDDRSEANGGKLGPHLTRSLKWEARYVAVKEKAKTYAGKDAKQMWMLHPAEHCKSCLKLSGKVKRASYWKSKGIYPKAWDKLDCHIGCKCTLEETDSPLSRGPLPNLP